MQIWAVLLDQGQYTEVDREHETLIAEFEQLVSEYPDDETFRRNLALELYNGALSSDKQGHWQKALELNGRALDIERQAGLANSFEILYGLRQRADLLGKNRQISESVATRQEVIEAGLSQCRKYQQFLNIS